MMISFGVLNFSSCADVHKAEPVQHTVLPYGKADSDSTLVKNRDAIIFLIERDDQVLLPEEQVHLCQ